MTGCTRFDPAEGEPVGDVVKVRGGMRVQKGDPGEVLVVTDHAFVHPLTKGGTSVRRTIVRRQITLALLDPTGGGAPPGDGRGAV
ncbi:hypothetical protein [Streptomyces avidinii]|uniref:KOW motif-containing protein n=1 Tax=Streptomyces avidinii TaxID=1895 RepID=A0ABS4L9S7_STRAV|nr:hypothetical protein [Streptomyces avidinii]MBP2038849.1 hypothetical protein [Streptomyces avidinii]GGZ11360.1 hypothetical protein GCM10010343_42400 [Streptomyces avidinii]